MNERELLRKIARDYTNLLKENLVGIYVHGSIAFGCFNWEKSDIDFLVVVHEEPALPQKEAMIQTLLALEKSGPPKGFEMSVVLRRYCEAFVYPTPYVLHYSNFHKERCRADVKTFCRQMNGTDADLAAHFTVTRAVGIALCGEAKEDLFGPVPSEYYWESIRMDVENAAEDIIKNPVYTVLNLCRVLAYRKEGLILSKKGGGVWGQKALPVRDHPLVQEALLCYESEKIFSFDPAQLRRFAADMLARIAGKGEDLSQRGNMADAGTPQ